MYICRLLYHVIFILQGGVGADFLERGNGRFLKKAPQKLLDWVAGLLG
jgi:hypothetical protein